MGANGSTPQDGESSRSGKSSSKPKGPEDLYDVLNVGPEATSDEIRKAFRREALKWHPDKNAGSEEASKRFIQIQAAYDVLSDDQERAYYDSHRHSINTDSTYEEDASTLRARAASSRAAKQSIRISSNQLLRFFDPSLYNHTNFTDDLNTGFYGIYKSLFEAIGQSEYYATSPIGEGPLSSEPFWYPVFGNAETSYDGTNSELKQFYIAFVNFSSRRPFNEADKYKLSDAEDRRMKRLMEKENKRARDDARREYNDTVRNLAMFVKKRDPRFLNSDAADPVKQRLKQKMEMERKLREEALQREKDRMERAKTFEVQDWQRISTYASDDDGSDEDEFDSGEDVNGEGADEPAGTDEEDDEEVQDWYCPACDKAFSSSGQWENHVRSRKHVQNTKRLKKEMQQEDDELGLSKEAAELDLDNREEEGNGDIPLPGESKKQRKKRLEKERRMGLHTDEPMDHVGGHINTTDEPAVQEMPVEQETDLQVGETAQPSADKEQDGDDSDEGDVEGTPSGTVSGTSTPVSAQISKKDKRRAREAAKKAAAANGASVGTAAGADDGDTESCNVCSASFPSRTKLFDHIKKTGHAAAVGSSRDSSGKIKGKKGKR